MHEIELSIMAHGTEPAGSVRPVLEQFEAQCRCHVRVRVLAWETAWTELVKIALYSTGPDVSEVGTNWISNLTAMEALRPFHPTELEAVGGAPAFLGLAWQSGRVIGSTQTWAVPWLADTRVILYRRDLLAKAGIDETTAFQTHSQFEWTLERLQASGVTSSPLVIPTQTTANTLHNLASWVWGAGGDFISVAGKRTLFNQPEAHAGIRAYLGLHRYLAPQARGLDARHSDSFYLQGQAAVTVSGPWLILLNLESSPAAQVIANTGVVLPPGVPFIGGSNLVIWKHTRQDRRALELVRFLTSQAVQSSYCQRAGLLPVRLNVLDAPAFVDHPLYRVMSEGLRVGRSFPSFSAWGLIEDGLTTELACLWADLRADSSLDLDTAITERLGPLAQRLDLTLGQTL